MEDVADILVDRLLSYVDPWYALGLNPDADLTRYKPRPDYVSMEPEARDQEYHYGRILHFLMLLESGEQIDPIELDNRCTFGTILPEPVIIDGCHRLMAAALAGRRTVPASYSGRVDLLRYLEGKSEVAP